MANVSSSNSLGERVPKLRFPEFEGGWVCEKLSDFTERVTRKNTNNETELPLTISSKDGLVDQISYFNKTVASKDMSGYYLLKHGEYAYNKSYSVGYSFGSIKRLDRYAMGALSTLYICFTLKKHNTDFVNTYFDSLKWYHEIHMISAEGARNHGLLNVPTEVFFETKHWLPINLDEQKKIAKFFQLLEYRIEIQQKLLDALKLYKRGLLSKLFPQKGESVPQYRFAGFTDAWEQRKLGEIVEFLDTLRKPLEGSKRASGSYPYYGASGIVDYVDDYIFDEELVLLSEDGANITDRNYPVCFIISGKTWVNNHAHVLKAKEGFDNNFLCNSLERKDYTPYNTGMAMPKLNKEVCKNIPVECPNYEEQKKIGSYLDSLDNLITLHQRKCNEMQSIKKFMLQNMFV